MSLPRLNRKGILLLAALTASTAALEAGPVCAQASGEPVIQVAAAAQRKSTHRRRHRRSPPGGVYARSAILVDPSSGKVLFEKNSERAAPIASLTKLMTAMVFLEQRPDLSQSARVTRAELRGGGHTQLRNREMVKLEDLLHMSLMCSDNVATRVLVRESGLTSEEFLERMNRKARELELPETRFVEFTGLDEGNVSTASGVARLLQAAADNDLIRQISTTRSYQFRSKTRRHSIPNTNRLLYNRSLEVLGGKTGFIRKAGYCVATWVRSQGRDMIAVVLGAPTNATRFADVLRLVRKAMDTKTARAES